MTKDQNDKYYKYNKSYTHDKNAQKCPRWARQIHHTMASVSPCIWLHVGRGKRGNHGKPYENQWEINCWLLLVLLVGCRLLVAGYILYSYILIVLYYYSIILLL